MLVGLARFELTTFRPPDGRATKLRYSPTRCPYIQIVGRDKRHSGSVLRLHVVTQGDKLIKKQTDFLTRTICHRLSSWR